MVRNRKWNFMGVMFALCLVMAADAAIAAAAEDRTEEQTVTEEQSETNLTESEIQPGERTATIMVIDITGNELTYYEVEDKAETETADSGMPQENGEMVQLEGIPQKDGGAEKQNEKTVYLPVPVVVHTDTDEKRTFSILEAGDRLQVTIVTDEDGNETITEIWMLGDEDKT